MGRTSDAKQQLIDSAIELFHSRSYADVGVNEICQHAGVKKGSFYHFFPSKQDLTLAALDETANLFERIVGGPSFAKDVPPLERIQRLFGMVYQHQCSINQETGKMWGCPFGNLAMELSTQDEPVRLKLKQIFEMITECLDNALKDAVACGALPEIDTATTAWAILAYLEGIQLIAKTWNDPDIIRQLAQKAVQLALPEPAHNPPTFNQ